MSEKRKSLGNSKRDAIAPVPPSKLALPAGYGPLLVSLKEQIQHTRLKAVLAANAAMVMLYWEIGNSIATRQNQDGWGAKVIDRLSHDLREAFPDMKGFSPRNLKYMRAFALAWPDPAFVQGSLAQIPRFSNIALLEKLDDPALRQWYAAKTVTHGWSQPVLCFQIARALHRREGSSSNNFLEALPPPQSDMARQVFKDPYVFDFLGTDAPRRELDIEKKLVAYVEKFFLELGAGFAFVGRQVLYES
jgi:predicted nuclease of restriction endonuclease-like (RecB) superfamily